MVSVLVLPPGPTGASGATVECSAGDRVACWDAHEDTATEAKEELVVVVEEVVGSMMMIILFDIKHMGC